MDEKCKMLVDELMKVVERLSNKENATAEEITALADVADVLAMIYRYEYNC